MALNKSQQVQFLERALELDPFHGQAANALAGAKMAKKPDQFEETGPSSDESAMSIRSEERPEPTTISPATQRRRRLVSLAMPGVLSAILAMGTPLDDIVLSIVFAVLGIACAVGTGALVTWYWRSACSHKRSLYQRDILVLYWTFAVTVLFAEAVAALVFQREFIFFAGFPLLAWVLAAIIGGIVLLFAEIPEKDKTDSD